MVYVLNKDGQPLMPTDRHGKIRRLLKEGMAEVYKRCPFTVRLLYDADTNLQPITLGINTGSKFVGLSATTESREVYSGEAILRQKIPGNKANAYKDITELLEERRSLRRDRRNRNTRYRQPRFLNRVSSKKEGWLAPSVEHRIESHMRLVKLVQKILPITSIIMDVSTFDIKKLKETEEKLARGETIDSLEFWNIREYVFWRDGYKCQCCKGKSKDPVLTVHHILSREEGGDSSKNLVTLCNTCHEGHHAGKITLPKKIKFGKGFSDEAFMNVIKWRLYERLKGVCPDVHVTFGYLTKNARIIRSLPKEHYIDARCISGNPDATPLGCIYKQRILRAHNRKLHNTIQAKNGYRKPLDWPKKINGFSLYDKVEYDGVESFITSKDASTNTFGLRFINLEPHIGKGKSSNRVTYRKLKRLESGRTIITAREVMPDFCNRLEQ